MRGWWLGLGILACKTPSSGQLPAEAAPRRALAAPSRAAAPLPAEALAAPPVLARVALGDVRLGLHALEGGALVTHGSAAWLVRGDAVAPLVLPSLGGLDPCGQSWYAPGGAPEAIFAAQSEGPKRRGRLYRLEETRWAAVRATDRPYQSYETVVRWRGQWLAFVTSNVKCNWVPGPDDAPSFRHCGDLPTRLESHFEWVTAKDSVPVLPPGVGCDHEVEPAVVAARGDVLIAAGQSCDRASLLAAFHWDPVATKRLLPSDTSCMPDDSGACWVRNHQLTGIAIHALDDVVVGGYLGPAGSVPTDPYLAAFDGKEWLRAEPPQHGGIESLARSDDGTLWVVTRQIEDHRLWRRLPSGWQEVPLVDGGERWQPLSVVASGDSVWVRAADARVGLRAPEAQMVAVFTSAALPSSSLAARCP